MEPSERSKYDELRRQAELNLQSAQDLLAQTKTGSAPPGATTTVGAKLNLARAAVAQMKSIPMSDAWVNTKLTADLGRLESELKRALLLPAPQVRPQPTGLAPSGPRDLDAEDRALQERILQSGETLNRADGYLRDTSRLLNEAREIGTDTLGVMSEQREMLLQTEKDVRETETSAVKARQVLRRMASRALRNRIFLWAVIFVLFVVDVLFVYYGFIKK